LVVIGYWPLNHAVMHTPPRVQNGKKPAHLSKCG
jgi:hypothetical protein